MMRMGGTEIEGVIDLTLTRERNVSASSSSRLQLENEERESRSLEVRREAELRRKTDLKLIRRRSSAPKNGRNPLEIFPKEIWTMILDWAVVGGDGDRRDLENARDVCSLFREILGKRYFIQVLLPQVLSLPTLRSPAVAKSIPKLRKVSRQWRQGVDAYIPEAISKFGWANGGHCPLKDFIGPIFRLTPSDQRSIEVADGIIADFDGEVVRGQGFSFFSRSIEVYLGLGTDPQEALHTLVFTTLPKLFGAVGSQVLHFNLVLFTSYIQRRGLSLAQVYLQLRDWVDGMPDLIWLEVTFSEGDRDWSFTPEERDQIKEAIHYNPFPKLEHLQHLTVSWNLPELEWETWFSTAILRDNGHVRHLEIVAHGDTDVDHGLQQESEPLPVVDLHQIESFVWASEAIYPSLISPTWPLTKIVIRISWRGSPDLHDLFRLLENFKALEWVQLELNCVLRRDPGYLRLPMVTHFNYEFSGTTTTGTGDHRYQLLGDATPVEKMYSIDFIYFMKRLEVFTWKHDRARTPVEVDEREVIQFRNGRMDLDHSNIWEVLPRLKRVRVVTSCKDRTYRRGERK